MSFQKKREIYEENIAKNKYLFLAKRRKVKCPEKFVGGLQRKL